MTLEAMSPRMGTVEVVATEVVVGGAGILTVKGVAEETAGGECCRTGLLELTQRTRRCFALKYVLFLGRRVRIGFWRAALRSEAVGVCWANGVNNRSGHMQAERVEGATGRGWACACVGCCKDS